MVEGMTQLGALYEVFDKNQRKQFIKFFVSGVFVDAKEGKIINFELVPEFEMLVSGDLVRITSNWLGTVENVRTILEKQGDCVYIPEVKVCVLK